MENILVWVQMGFNKVYQQLSENNKQSKQQDKNFRKRRKESQVKITELRFDDRIKETMGVWGAEVDVKDTVANGAKGESVD